MSKTVEAWGLDIAQGRWAQVRLQKQAKRTQLAGHEVRDFANRKLPGSIHVVIDVPIGLLSDERAARCPQGISGGREVDAGARKWCLVPGSVFSPPTQGQLRSGLQELRRARAAGTRPDLKRVSPGGLSHQCLNILPAIDSASRLKARGRTRVHESHPEVAFAAMTGWIPPAKKSLLTGLLLRVALLERHLEIEGLLKSVLDMESETGIRAADWVDALAMAAVALDWATGASRQVLRTADGRISTLRRAWEPAIALPRTHTEVPPPRGGGDQREARALLEEYLAGASLGGTMRAAAGRR